MLQRNVDTRNFNETVELFATIVFEILHTLNESRDF